MKRKENSLVSVAFQNEMLKMKVYGHDIHYFSQQVGRQSFNHKKGTVPFLWFKGCLT